METHNLIAKLNADLESFTKDMKNISGGDAFAEEGYLYVIAYIKVFLLDTLENDGLKPVHLPMKGYWDYSAILKKRGISG